MPRLRLGSHITTLPVLVDVNVLLDTPLSWRAERTPTPEREARDEREQRAQERRARSEFLEKRQADRLFRGAVQIEEERDPHDVMQTLLDPVVPVRRPSKEKRKDAAAEERVYVQRRMPSIPLPPAPVKRKRRVKSPTLDAMLSRIGSDYGLRRLRVAEQSACGLKDRKAILREDILTKKESSGELKKCLREEPGGRLLEVENIPVYEDDPVKAAQEARRRVEERRQMLKRLRTESDSKQSDGAAKRKIETLSTRKTVTEGPPEQPSSHKLLFPWTTVLPPVIPGQQKISVQRKEACDSMRVIVLGRIGTEKYVDKEKMYYEQMGSRDQVLKLWQMWILVDEGEAGEMDFNEFCKHIPKSRSDRQGLAEKVQKLLVQIKRPCITLSDVMRILWPGCRDEHIKEMKSWLQEYERRRQRVPTPPLLSQDQRDGLSENFRVYDRDQSGSVSIQELIYAGLITDEMNAVFREFDQDNNGSLDAQEFLQMLCPCGYRAEASARSCFDEDGLRLILDDSDQSCCFWKRFDMDTNQRDLDGWIHPALRTHADDRRHVRADMTRPSFIGRMEEFALEGLAMGSEASS